ncbi:MAG: efflux RND transporter periplasmic adaptor subunit [Pseudomonadota bacterium]
MHHPTFPTSNRNPARRKLVWLALTALVVVGGGAAFLISKNSAARSAEAAKKNAPAVTLEFTTGDIAKVALQPLVRTSSVSGTLTPLTQAVVKATVAGEVRKVLVREGMAVKQGDVLAELDTTDLRTRLDAAQADQAERRAKLAIAERNRDTNQALLKQNFISQSAFDQLLSTYQGSEAAVRWSDAQVQLAKKAMDDAVVRAPISGTVSKRMVNGGERVLPDAAIATIVDLSRLELEASVPASDIASIALGQAVHFSVDGFGDRAFEGKVERINPVAEAGSRAIKLFVAVPNASGLLRGGMFAQGQITLSQSKPVPVVPATALFEEAGQSYVFTVEGGKIAKKAVGLGARDEVNGLVEVNSGLAQGADVVRVRMGSLKVGAPAVVRANAK